MKIKLLPYELTVCQAESLNAFNMTKDLFFVGKTDQELSVVCPTNDVPETTIHREDGWRGFRLEGVLEFSLVGILAEISTLLAENQISIFALSTFNTDYILVKQENLHKALEVLMNHGYKVINDCRSWSEGDPILEEYHDHEWCKINHDDDFEFMMLCLEGASVGLSWQTIMHKKPAYLDAFHGFNIHACSQMTDEELEKLLENPGLIRNRNKIFSVRKNAQVVQAIQKEYDSFDAYLWSFVDGKQIDGHWKSPREVPTVSDISTKLSKDMKKRGIGFVGPVITYSFMQSIGMVNDHLDTCPYR